MSQTNQLLNMLRRRAMSAVLWQALFVCAVVWGFYSTHLAEQTAMGRMRFAAMDSRNTFYLSSLGSFETAEKIHAETAKMAAETIFNRSPAGLENLERVDRLFDEKIAAYLKNKVGEDSKEFTMAKRHQSIETGEIRELGGDSNTVLVSVQGQVLSQFEFNSKVSNDTKPVTLFLKLEINPSMGSNGMFPLIVKNYEVRY